MDKYKKIPNYKPYAISKEGVIINTRTGRVIKTPSINNCGYRLALLSPDGKPRVCRSIHRLVAIAWLGLKEESEMVVDHIDRDRLNNKLENLRIVTRSENQMNIEHSGHKRFPNASHITKDKRFNTWLVRVKFRGSYVIHKNFPSIEEAQIARDDAVQKREEMLRCG